MKESDHPLVALVYQEMLRYGNLTTACPVKKGLYYLHNFMIMESDLPTVLPKGRFKVEINGTLHSNDKDIPLFTSDIYFSEA